MQDVIGRRIDRFLSRSDSRKAFRFLYKKYLDFVYEFKIRTGKGNEKYVETLGNPIRFKGEQALILNLRDITERKKAEHSLMEAYSSLQNEIREREEAERALDNYRVHLEAMVGERTAELRRANQLLEMEIAERQKSEQKIKDLNMLLLSTKRITESLLRANTEEELFQTTCDLLAELDFIELVWAGFAETEHFNVKPVAWSGREDGYLSSVKITWDDSEYRQGPDRDRDQDGVDFDSHGHRNRPELRALEGRGAQEGLPFRHRPADQFQGGDNRLSHRLFRRIRKLSASRRSSS